MATRGSGEAAAPVRACVSEGKCMLLLYSLFVMSKTLNKEMKTIVSRFLCNPGARAAHSGGDLKV